jgi:hypothetical protein
MGDPLFMDGLFHGESENPPKKMDDSRGTPILGNLHKHPYAYLPPSNLTWLWKLVIAYSNPQEERFGSSLQK